MKHNEEALRLPDPLLVRFFREGLIDRVQKVTIDDDRNVVVEIQGGATRRYLHLVDVGWVPIDDACDS